MITAEERPKSQNTRETLLAAQEISVKQELESIRSFLRRSGWNMQETGTGLYYEIYETAPENAPKAVYGDAVKISYTIRLLNGEEISSSDTDGLKTFIIGKSETESGLVEAVLLMRKGERARLIIPSHLAYGFSGDGDRIPPRASLLYDLCIEEVLIPPKNK